MTKKITRANTTLCIFSNDEEEETPNIGEMLSHIRSSTRPASIAVILHLAANKELNPMLSLRMRCLKSSTTQNVSTRVYISPVAPLWSASEEMEWSCPVSICLKPECC